MDSLQSDFTAEDWGAEGLCPLFVAITADDRLRCVEQACEDRRTQEGSVRSKPIKITRFDQFMYPSVKSTVQITKHVINP